MVRILTPSGPSVDRDADDCRSAAAERSYRLGVSVVCGALLVACGLLLIGSAGEPIGPPRNAADSVPFMVNVNADDWAVLSLVPGLGEALSRRIVEHREAHGPYRSLDELTVVVGIGQITLEEIRPYLVLDDPASCERLDNVEVRTGQ